jgi:branched-chain amino acid transport system permease protein
VINQLLLNGIIAGSIYTIIALSYSIIYRIVKFFHFAHAIVFTLGAYFAYLYAFLLGLSLVASIFLAVLSATFIGILIELIVYRPLRKKGSTPLILLLSSFGVYIVLQNIISIAFGDNSNTLRKGIVHEGIEIFGARISQTQILILIVNLVLLIGCWAMMKYTKIGSTMRAVAANSELAFATGIDTNKVILFAFTIGSFLAGIAGILISFDTDMTPTMGMNTLMMGVVAVIIGGVGSIPGAALGAFLLAFAQNLGVWKISSQWQDAIAFIVLLLFLLIRPQGFFGKKIRKAEV